MTLAVKAVFPPLLAVVAATPMRCPTPYFREPPAHVSPSVDPAAPFTPKVQSLLAAMTLEEKRQLIHGSFANPMADSGYVGQAGFTPGIVRLGIPPRRDADALGINVTLETTAVPTRMGLGATFDRNAINEMGFLVGQEGLARGVDVLYGPQVDIARLPNWARNNTTFGEDPYLAGELAAMEVAGVQGTGLMDDVKHFALYDGQPNQYSIIDDQVAHEIYLAPFAAAVRRAQPASMMCSYAQFQLTPVQAAPAWACHSDHLLNVILHGQWDYRGLVLSDYTAVHSADLLNGLDQEFATNYFTADWLASVSGDPVVVAAIDQAVARNLYQLERFGYLNCANPDPSKVDPACVPGPIRPSMDSLIAAHQDQTEKLAEKTAVLLKNDGKLLPISTAALAGGVVVIGPAAKFPLIGPGGERSKGFAARNRKGPFVALQELAPAANLTYVPGIDWVGSFPPDGALTTSDGSENCLMRDDYDGATKTTTTGVSCDAIIDYSTASTNLPANHRYTWTGKLVIPKDGVYYLWMRLGGALPLFGSPATLQIDGTTQSLAATSANANEFEDGLVSSGAPLTLTAGAHDVVLTVANLGSFIGPATGPIYAQLRWAPYDETRQAALDAAAGAHLVVVFANDGGGNSTGMAGTASTVLASLDANQDDLISALAQVNPNIVVVLQTGQPVAMPWCDAVPAVLETWYPGQEGGYATANLLLGNANPGGKLPITFPVRAEDTPFSGDLFAERVSGVTDDTGFCGTTSGCRKITWSEGLLVGYRWYDQMDIDPAFAFGEGLSYTTFSYSHLKAVPARGGIDVTFVVRNTGTREGDAIPQIYLVAPRHVPEGVQTAKKALAGFERVPLRAGEAKIVTIHVHRRQLSYWSTDQQDWVKVGGPRTVYLSTSSRQRDVVAQATVFIP